MKYFLRPPGLWILLTQVTMQSIYSSWHDNIYKDQDDLQRRLDAITCTQKWAMALNTKGLCILKAWLDYFKRRCTQKKKIKKICHHTRPSTFLYPSGNVFIFLIPLNFHNIMTKQRYQFIESLRFQRLLLQNTLNIIINYLSETKWYGLHCHYLVVLQWRTRLQPKIALKCIPRRCDNASILRHV